MVHVRVGRGCVDKIGGCSVCEDGLIGRVDRVFVLVGCVDIMWLIGSGDRVY